LFFVIRVIYLKILRRCWRDVILSIWKPFTMTPVELHRQRLSRETCGSHREQTHERRKQRAAQFYNVKQRHVPISFSCVE
jgi:hypothetical protein